MDDGRAVLKARVQRLAQARQRSSHWLMLEAVEQYVDREERREASRVTASKAWEDYQRTGLHVTAGEADAWMARLESGKDADPPECHARDGVLPAGYGVVRPGARRSLKQLPPPGRPT
ncbi:ribbon-helix-helix protein, CopG family [Lysobacter sp. GX 14042]|nr:ribbon-helix-helix protein, CopG family [Lysobacter sp. GX 14042]MCE7031164.1 ribbon-helix-helix protein, CopG family [Lysobacter sp. GX 14042]